jgi:hemerythrin superfamily protein
MDVIDIVKKDHDRVEELFSKFRGGGGLTGLVKRVTGNVPTRQRRTAVDGICRELDIHARLEEEILYPAARATGDGEIARMIDESLREHARVKELVRELRTGKHEGDELDNRVNALEECVSHHVNEEEGEMLPRLEEVMSPEERADLGRRFQAGKGRSAPRARKATARARTKRTRVARAVKSTRQKKRARKRTAQRK